jgi:autonomous glycyl radical cofactor GrcA
MDIFSQIVDKIIKEQEGIIGPIALEQAQKVPGLKIDNENHINIEGDKKSTLENLVKQYEKLFGPASIEVCRDAVKGIIGQAPQDQIPQLLL